MRGGSGGRRGPRGEGGGVKEDIAGGEVHRGRWRVGGGGGGGGGERNGLGRGRGRFVIVEPDVAAWAEGCSLQGAESV